MRFFSPQAQPFVVGVFALFAISLVYLQITPEYQAGGGYPAESGAR